MSGVLIDPETLCQFITEALTDESVPGHARDLLRWCRGHLTEGRAAKLATEIATLEDRIARAVAILDGEEDV